MSECNRGVWQLGHANVLLMFFLGPWLRVLLLRRRESEALKRILRTAYAFFFFFCSCQINIAQGDFWFSSSFSWKTGRGKTKPGLFCVRRFDVGCELRWQGPGSVCGNNASVQRVTQMLTALLFLKIQNRTAEHTERTLVTWNLRWRALIKLSHKQHPAQLISLSDSLFNSPSHPAFLHGPNLILATFLHSLLCLSFLPNLSSLPTFVGSRAYSPSGTDSQGPLWAGGDQ